MPLGVSVIVCCYNSSQRLPSTLKHLAKQRVPSWIAWEVVIVDNASTDGTGDLALSEWNKLNVSVTCRVITETIPGLSSARLRGVKEAMFDFFIFCDDDNWLSEDYLFVAFSVLQQRSDVGILTGIIHPDFENLPPPWFDAYSGGYAIGQPALNSGYLENQYSVVGAGLVSRRSVFLEAYRKFPSILSDRLGSLLVSGGDSEYTLRVIMMGYRIYFDERLLMKHHIPSSRLTAEYRDRLFLGFKTSAVILDFYRNLILIGRESSVAKIVLLIKSLLRYLIAWVGYADYDLSAEALRIFSITGWRFGRIDKPFEMILDFKKEVDNKLRV